MAVIKLKKEYDGRINVTIDFSKDILIQPQMRPYSDAIIFIEDSQKINKFFVLSFSNLFNTYAEIDFNDENSFLVDYSFEGREMNATPVARGFRL